MKHVKRYPSIHRRAGDRRWGVLAVATIAWLAAGERSASADEPAASGEIIWSAHSAEGSSLYSLAVDDDALYVIGNGQGSGRIEKRNLDDGSLIWAQSIGAREGMHLTIDDEAMYIAGSPWQVKKRGLDDGSLHWHQDGRADDGGKPYGIVVHDDALYIAGRTNSSPRSWRIEKRSRADGEVLWTQTGLPGVALAVTADDTGVYLGGYDTEPGSQRWRIEKRDHENGELLWDVARESTKDGRKVYGLYVDDSGVYAAGQSYADGEGAWLTGKRDRDDGSLIWEVHEIYSASVDKAHGLNGDADGIYIPGYENSRQWRTEMRDLEDGSLIWASMGASAGRLWYAVDSDDTAVYVGGYVNEPERQWRIDKIAK